MDTRKQYRTDQSTRANGTIACRGSNTGGVQLSQGYRPAGGPDYRSNDRQTSEHPRVKHGG